MTANDLRFARRLITSAIVALVIGAVLTLLGGVVNSAWGALAAAVSLVVTWLCSWQASRFMQAGTAYYVWTYVPVVVLVGLPLSVRIFRFVQGIDDGIGAPELMFWAQPLCGFVVPMVLLAMADWSLRRLAARLENVEPIETETPAVDQLDVL